MFQKDWKGNEQRRFSRIGCRLISEFQLLEGNGVWLTAEVLDFSIAGIRICFSQEQCGTVLDETDIEWREAFFRFRETSEEVVLKGHFLMVYEKGDGYFTTGVEFLGVAPEEQIKLLRLYAAHRCDESGFE